MVQCVLIILGKALKTLGIRKICANINRTLKYTGIHFMSPCRQVGFEVSLADLYILITVTEVYWKK